jgi:hydrogenase expression/formation protein HypE
MKPETTRREPINLESWTCPLPLRNYPTIVLGHGSGGRLMADLIQHLFAPLFANDTLAQMGDSAVLSLASSAVAGLLTVPPSAVAGLLTVPPGSTAADVRLAFTTDSYVITPIFFPGGDIGRLAVNGTINDLAMSGATPLFLSAGFILEEGLAMDDLGRVATSMAEACRQAGVQLVAGDTKVVGKGSGDQVFINTSGLGLVPAGVDVRPDRAQPGDVVIISGAIGVHGIAILSVREGLDFETTIASDTAPLHGLVAAMLGACHDLHCLRDPTRGGLASTLNEIATASQAGIVLHQKSIPIWPQVAAACEMLGLDPLYVANEGKLVAVVPRESAEVVLAAMRAHPLGREAAIIGEVTDQHSGLVVMKTGIGGTRIVDMLAGEQLPRIC